MVEEVVVKEALTDKMIEAGKELLHHLDSHGVRVDTAFWHYKMIPGLWRLVLSSPEVDQDGPMKAYSRLMDALQIWDTPKLAFQDIAFLSENSDIVKPFIGLGQEYINKQITRWFINRHYVDDAYIYRLPPIQPVEKKTRRKTATNGHPMPKQATSSRKKAVAVHA